MLGYQGYQENQGYQLQDLVCGNAGIPRLPRKPGIPATGVSVGYMLGYQGNQENQGYQLQDLVGYMLGYQGNQENQGYQLQELVWGIWWDTKITKKTRDTIYRT